MMMLTMMLMTVMTMIDDDNDDDIVDVNDKEDVDAVMFRSPFVILILCDKRHEIIRCKARSVI